MVIAAVIQNLDLSKVKKKLCLAPDQGGYGWPADAADEAIVDYRKFLQAQLDKEKLVNPTPINPDQLVDIVWHTHILFTKDYHADCQKIFKHYLHHTPQIN